jgi:hypothetical protein
LSTFLVFLLRNARKKNNNKKIIFRIFIGVIFQKKMASWENFLEWQKRKSRCWDNELQKIAQLYYDTQIELFEMDPLAYLVKYRKSQMLDWTGLMDEDHIVPNDDVINFFEHAWKVSRPNYNSNSDYMESRHVHDLILELAMKELKAQRPAPICEMKSINEFTESQIILANQLFYLLFNTTMPKHSVFVACNNEKIFAITHIDFNDNKITYFGVHPNFRKRGYGETLLAYLKSQFSGLTAECTTKAGIEYFEKYAISKTVRFTL